MIAFVKDCKDVGLVIASGIVGIGLLALFGQTLWFVSLLVRKFRGMCQKPPKIALLPAPDVVKYLPRP
jgi:hypothetical protein